MAEAAGTDAGVPTCVVPASSLLDPELTVAAACVATPVPATVPAPGTPPVRAVSLDPCFVPPPEDPVPLQASPAPAGRPANDPPPLLLVPVAPPPTIAPPGPAHWLTGALPDGSAPIPLPPGQNSIKYCFVNLPLKVFM